MLKLLFLLLIFSIGYLHAAEYAIFIESDAISAEKTASIELQKFLTKLSNKKVVISSSNDKENHTYKFYLGQSAKVKKALNIKDFNSFAPDEIKIARIGNNFYLTGSRPRGTLYAVHTFLEDFCGITFYAPDEIKYPSTFTLPKKINYQYAPPFIIRETPFAPLRLNSEFAARRKVNGHWQNTTPAWGGHETIWGFCHTFNTLIPPKKYAKTNPEYYSFIDGARRPVGNQLCLSNSNLRKELIKNIRSILKNNKDTKIISISQNDNKGFCRCQNCNALASKFGNRQSGILVDCLNEIASSLEKEFPNVYFETLAYEYSVEPPKNITPRKNVLIRLCADNCDYGRALNTPSNSKFSNSLIAWSKLTKNLMVWNYVSIFYNHIIPNPNWNLHGTNLRFFKDNNVIAVFNQAGGGQTGDFAPLRAYVNSKLLWNPSLDESQLIEDFVKNYYGKEAYPIIIEYLKLMKIDYSKQKKDFKLTWNTTSSDWLSFEDTLKARKLMVKAVKLSKGKYRQRVEIAKTAIDFALLLHPQTSKHYKNNLKEVREILANFCLKTRNDKKYGEGLLFDSLKKSLWQLYGNKKQVSKKDLPKEFSSIPLENIVVIPAKDITAYENKVRTFWMDNFIRMRADHKGWLIQFPGLNMRTQNEGCWIVYAQVRTGGTPTTKGYALQTGLYYPNSKKNINKRYQFNNTASKEFKVIKVSEFTSGQENIYFYCAPTGNNLAYPIDIKNLILVKKQ